MSETPEQLGDDAAYRVSLESYAFVTAGLSDGLTLDELLEFVAVDPHHWPGAEVYWLGKMSDGMQSDMQIFFQFDALQQQARTTWERAIPPLDNDLRAWLDFQRLLGQRDDPAAYLASIPLSPGEMGGLQRQWAKRMGSDPELLKQMAAIFAETPQPVEVPPPAKPALPRMGSADAVTGTGFVSMAAVESALAELALPFDGQKMDGVSVAPPLIADLPPPPAVPNDGIDRTGFVDSAALESFFSGTSGGLPSMQPSEKASPAPSTPPPFPEAPAIAEEPQSSFPVGSAIPRPTPQPSAPPSRPPPLSSIPPASPSMHMPGAPLPVAPAIAAANIDQTAFVDPFAFIDALAMPFAPGGATTPPPMGSAMDDGPDPLAGGTGFLDMDAVKTGPGGFLTAAEERALDAQGTADSINETGFIDEALLAFEALPFSGRAAAQPAHTSSAAPTHDELSGATGFVDLDALVGDAVPFPITSPSVSPAGSTTLPPWATAPLFGPGSLTMVQYAAFEAEMHLNPAHGSALSAQYGLTPQSRTQHSWAVRALIESEPTAEATWQTAQHNYLQWRHQQSGELQS